MFGVKSRAANPEWRQGFRDRVFAKLRHIYQDPRVNPTLRGLIWLVALAGAMPAAAEEKPSWAVMDAADRLIAKHALFMPGRDGFIKRPDGKLIQFELPSKFYHRDGKNWQVDLLSRRWREEGAKGWLAWHDARPKYSQWKIGVIHVMVYDSGVNAQWADGTSFIGCTAPGEAEVTHRLGTEAQGHVSTPLDQAESPVRREEPTRRRFEAPAKVKPSPSSGLYRRKADGSVEKIPL